MKKKLSVAVVLILTIFLLTGCYSTQTTFDINKDGNANIEFMVQADETMAGDEVSVAMWGLINSFPELKENYDITQQRKTIDYSDYLIYKFESKGNYNINSIEGIKFTQNDGVYNFKMEIPPLVSDFSEDNKDDVMFILKVNLPNDIDMANSSNYEDNKITWKISREQLANGLTLKAFTVE